MKIQKIISMLVVFVLLLSTLVFATPDIELSAESAILIEATTGQVLYEKNSEEKMYPASITKILTAIIALEECNLTDIVTVSEIAVSSLPQGSSTGELKSGETFTVEQLLYALLVNSGNDAANVLAEHIAGSNESFATMMNTKATEIGATTSNFVNPHGLHDEKHYVTAKDMVLIAKYAMSNEVFRRIVSTQTYTMPNTEIYTDEERVYTNTNLMLFDKAMPGNSVNYYYEYITGIKTGQTSQAGKTLVASAKKDNMELICVILGVRNSSETANRYLDAKKLFTYGFNNYFLTQITTPIKNIEISNAKKGQELEVQIKDNGYLLSTTSVDASSLNYRMVQKQGLMAPINQGDEIGTIIFDINDQVYEYTLVAKNNVEVKDSIFETIMNFFKWIFKIIFYIILIFIAIVVLFRIFVILTRKKRRKRKRSNGPRRRAKQD
ncbi:MAG: D-alanyl-D-alanine carboxypeptidase [Clostridiales bacterium]|nr:D-alanyl-D-alanine carboxypeptidase [Clostridiales bacterium]